MLNCFPTRRIKPIIARRDLSFQPIAPEIRISQLMLIDKDNYKIVNSIIKPDRSPNGLYTFVIPLDDPECIRVMPHGTPYGHTSLMQTRYFPEVRPINYDPAPVCYAGQVSFYNGRMLWWDTTAATTNHPKTCAVAI